MPGKHACDHIVYLMTYSLNHFLTVSCQSIGSYWKSWMIFFPFYEITVKTKIIYCSKQYDVRILFFWFTRIVNIFFWKYTHTHFTYTDLSMSQGLISIEHPGGSGQSLQFTTVQDHWARGKRDSRPSCCKVTKTSHGKDNKYNLQHKTSVSGSH